MFVWPCVCMRCAGAVVSFLAGYGMLEKEKLIKEWLGLLNKIFSIFVKYKKEKKQKKHSK